MPQRYMPNRMKSCVLSVLRFDSLSGADQYMRVASLHPGRTAFDAPISRQILCESAQQSLAKVGMGDLTSAELHDGLDPIAFLQKSDGMVLLEFVVVIVGVRPEFQFF